MKAAVGKPADITTGAIAKWFEESLQSQLDRVYSRADIPVLQRPPAWDFVTFEATIIGATDDGVVLSVSDDLAIHGIGDDSRGNLSRLGKMVGSTFRFIGRVAIEGLRTVSLLAIFYKDADDKTESIQLELEHFQIERERDSVAMDFPERPRPWGCYERAFERAMLGGWRTFPANGRAEGTRDQKRLTGFGMYHGATRLGTLLDAAQRIAGSPPDAVVFADAWCNGLKYRSFFLRALSQSEWEYDS